MKQKIIEFLTTKSPQGFKEWEIRGEVGINKATCYKNLKDLEKTGDIISTNTKPKVYSLNDQKIRGNR